MSNREIEDVLASIRRLVSEDLRPAPKAPLAAEPFAVDEAGDLANSGQLLLTPSLRIVATEAAPDMPPAADLAWDHEETQVREVEQETVAEPEAAVVAEHSHAQALTQAQAQDVHGSLAQVLELDAPYPEGWPVPTVTPSALDAKSPLPAVDVLVLAPEMTSSFGDAPRGKDQVIARVGAAVSEGDWEAAEGDPSVWAQNVPVPSRPAEATFSHRPRTSLTFAPSAPDFTDPPVEAFFGFPPDLTATHPDDAPVVAEDEVGQAVPLRQVKPPQDVASWADAAEAAVMADLADAVARDLDEDLYDPAEPGMTAFDEEVLRELVRDLIREELAGTLGERITRNVRKLVRSEIARALALREFE